MPNHLAEVPHDLLLSIASPEAWMLFPREGEGHAGMTCSMLLPSHHCWPLVCGPQVSVLCPYMQAQYLVYKPFFLQKEFFTDSRRLLSSRAGKLLSSKLSISPWPSAPDLVFPPEGKVVWEMDGRLVPVRSHSHSFPVPFSHLAWILPFLAC